MARRHKVQGYTLQTEKIPDFSRRNCKQYVEHLLIQIFREHHVWKMNYSTGVELPATGGHVGTIMATFCTSYIRLIWYICVYILSIVDLAVFFKYLGHSKNSCLIDWFMRRPTSTGII